MENNELQRIWKSVDAEINQRSKDELNLLLTSKARQTIGKFIIILFTSVIVSIGLLFWLVITSLNRQDDVIYLMNNATLGIIAIIGLLSGIMSWYKLQNNRFDQPLRSWLEIRIKYLSRYFTGRFSKLYLFLIPFFYILTTLSIHVYYEYKPFIEVFNTEESLIGLIVGTPIGLFVSYYAVSKIRKFQLHHLEFLKDLHGRICHEIPR